ncbi:hypothetical protein QRD40_02420 [Comamonas sp. Y6]|uniref:Uncharacterized protein n=1 Tax=Comamonas resistens TaxID=3046670 RepID=A0ABY8SVV3_9BURK|nr:hypothetical protein [Comamonas resistens]MDL5035196.1 hypothetical protein [Comamonas resistens]WHS66736.1 hypothetical protein QMY55_06250 [Comamonas resistens]
MQQTDATTTMFSSNRHLLTTYRQKQGFAPQHDLKSAQWRASLFVE